MGDTPNNINIPKNTWVDINTESGIAVGQGIIVQNIGSHFMKIVRKATGTPTSSDGYNFIQSPNDENSWIEVSAGEPRVWVHSDQGSSINVQEV